MRIKTKLKLNVVALLIVPSIFALCIAVGLHWAERLTDQLHFADQIEHAALELSVLCQQAPDDLPHGHYDRCARTITRIRELLSRPSRFTQQADFIHLGTTHRRIERQLALCKGLQNGDPGLRPQAAAAHFSRTVAELVDAAQRFKSTIYTDFSQHTRTGGILAVCVIASLALAIGCTATWGGRRLLRRFERLSLGMRAVSNGDLSHSISMSSDDEIGEVACEFDRMTSRLQDTLLQQQQLNTEIKMHEITENEIYRAQETTRQWLNSCTDGVWDWYLDDDYEYMSPHFWELFGYDPETRKHHPSEWQEILHPEDIHKVTEGFENHISSKGAEPFREELRFLHKDGHTIWVLNRGKIIEWHADGSPKRMVGTHTDITRTKLAERRERETRELLSAVLNQSPDSIFIMGLDGRLQLINEIGARRYGMSLDAIQGSTNHDLYPAEEAERMSIIDREIIDSGEVHTYEETIHDGTTLRVMLTSKAPFRNSKDKIVGLIGMSRDISVLSATRKALMERSEEFERSNTELQQFAYIASHDLQEPLRKISAFGELLRQTNGARLSEEGKAYLDFMENGALRMQTLVRDLLNLSRISTQTKVFERVDLNTICEAVLADLELTIEESGGRVDVAKLPAVEADPSQMRQLLQNLIGNALKFRRTDTPLKIRIGCEKLSPGADGHSTRCGIFVSDNGIGFDEKDSERVFGVFQRLHAKLTYPGSGIGLAICRKIVERHNGKIRVKSSPGKGAIFYIELPTWTSETSG